MLAKTDIFAIEKKAPLFLTNKGLRRKVHVVAQRKMRNISQQERKRLQIGIGHII